MRQRIMQWVPTILCVIGAIVILVVPHDRAGVIVRSVVFLGLMAPMPGWSLVRASGIAHDWIERTVAAVIASMAFVGAFGFFTTAVLNHAWTLHVDLAVVVGLTIVGTLLGGAPVTKRVATGAIGLMVALVLAVAGSAIAVHLLVPAAPVETAFSLQIAGARLTPATIEVSVTVHEVGPSGPARLVLSATYHTLDTVVVPRGTSTVVLRGVATAETGNLCNDLIKVSAPNSTYLTPVLVCHTAAATSR